MKSFMLYIYAVAFVLIMALSASATDEFNPAELSPMERTDIGEDIAHYTYEITLDADPYGKIRLHRFVRELQPYQPIQTSEGILILPGGWAKVVEIYGASLISEHATWDHSILVYLAKNNIDVWGMDYAWALVPAETEDFHFMKNWTMVKDVRHAMTALSIVRSIREYTGQGTDKLNLLGHSYGAAVGYGVLSEETQKPAQARKVKAFIPADDDTVAVPERQWELCASANEFQSMWDSGAYADNLGSVLTYLAWLAKSDPDGASPIIDDFTNYQAFLYWAAFLMGHYVDENGVPTDLRFTDPQFAIDVYLGFAPYWPIKVEWEYYTLKCSEVTVRGYEHIGEIEVPILYVGAVTGAGEDGYYTLTLTQSDDISKFTVKLLSDDEQTLDFGHADLFTANDAEILVWKPILNWINAH
jgi:hypothetical protein